MAADGDCRARDEGRRFVIGGLAHGLYAHVLRPLPVFEPEVEAAFEREHRFRSAPVNPRRVTLQDVKDFLLAYCACFMAIMAFVS